MLCGIKSNAGCWSGMSLLCMMQLHPAACRRPVSLPARGLLQAPSMCGRHLVIDADQVGVHVSLHHIERFLGKCALGHHGLLSAECT